MTAKSLSSRLPDAAKLARVGRQSATVLVLIASLAALFLILVQQHGHVFKGAYARIMPSLLFKPAAAPAALPVVAADRFRREAVAEFVANRYRVSYDVALDFVGIAHAAGHRLGLDPLLILAVMAVESRFNPIAESVVGAKGLMQIIPKYHADKLDSFGGEKAIFDPETNIMVGSQILHEYLRRTGNLSMALQMYAGALADEQDIYTERVMGEKRRLQAAAQRGDARSRNLVAMGERTRDGGPLGR